MVYVELEEGASLERVTKGHQADPYFSNDETHVCSKYRRLMPCATWVTACISPEKA